MKTKQLGNTTLTSPPLMFGGNVFGWTLNEKESFRMLDMLLERGFTFIDTADVYGQKMGLSEQIIGSWLKDRGVRDKITLATKAGRVYHKDAKGKKVKGMDNSSIHLSQSLTASLKRLQTTYLDLFYTHFDDQTTPVEKVLETHHHFIETGKTRYIGASNFSKARLKAALKAAQDTNLPRYKVFQTEYSLVERQEFETGLRRVCADYNLSVVSYFSLASGFLTGKYRKTSDFKGTARQNLTEKYFDKRGKKILKTLDEIAEEHGISNAGVALGWILKRPNISNAIASATQEKHLDAFQEAVNLNLSSNEMDRLNEVSHF